MASWEANNRGAQTHAACGFMSQSCEDWKLKYKRPSSRRRKQPVGHPDHRPSPPNNRSPPDTACRQSEADEIIAPGAQVRCTVYIERAGRWVSRLTSTRVCIPDLSSSSVPLPTVSLEIRICTASPSSCAERDHW